MECPKLQNIAMRALLKRDIDFAQQLDHSACSPECLIMDRQIIMMRSREHIIDTGVTHDAEGDHMKRKLFLSFFSSLSLPALSTGTCFWNSCALLDAWF